MTHLKSWQTTHIHAKDSQNTHLKSWQTTQVRTIDSQTTHPKSWQTTQFRAMGSQITIWVDAAEYSTTLLKTVFKLVEDLFCEYENVFSRFWAESELSRLNLQAGTWVEVSLPMWNVLQAALDLASATDGLFDPTILDALEVAGYTQSFTEMETAVTPITNPAAVTYQPINAQATSFYDIRFDEFNQSVFMPAGTRIDLGGIAKGYTAQQAVNLLQSWLPCLVNAGGDLTAGAAPHGFAGWPVAVSTPKTVSEPVELFSLWLAEGSLATSGIDYRHWQRNGRNAHHLIDPVTGQPAETDAITTTVLAKDAASAEAWATAALIGGTTRGLSHLVANKLPAMMITQDNKIKLTAAMVNNLAIDVASV